MTFSVRHFGFLLWWGYCGRVHYDGGGEESGIPWEWRNGFRYFEVTVGSQGVCVCICGCVNKYAWLEGVVQLGTWWGETKKIPGPTFNNEDYLQQMIKAITWILITVSGSSEGNGYIITVVARIILVHSRSSFWCFFVPFPQVLLFISGLAAFLLHIRDPFSHCLCSY